MEMERFMTPAELIQAAPVAASKRFANELLDPEMSASNLRLHMGELTAQEIRTARAAIAWANSRVSAPSVVIRDQALENAANACESWADYPFFVAAAAIRARKGAT
jgi:hypothetical protein